MDVDAPQYAADHSALRATILELERRLGALIIQAFDDCTTLSSTFKLLDSFEGLLEREAIAAELAKKQVGSMLHSTATCPMWLVSLALQQICHR